MMSINGFAYRIGTLSKPPGMTVKAVRRAMRTASVPLVAAAIALGASPAIAQNQDQVSPERRQRDSRCDGLMLSDNDSARRNHRSRTHGNSGGGVVDEAGLCRSPQPR
jgi:hypothetical protein